MWKAKVTHPYVHTSARPHRSIYYHTMRNENNTIHPLWCTVILMHTNNSSSWKKRWHRHSKNVNWNNYRFTFNMENNETVESKREIKCSSSWFQNMKNNEIAEYVRGDWYFYLLKFCTSSYLIVAEISSWKIIFFTVTNWHTRKKNTY